MVASFHYIPSALTCCMWSQAFRHLYVLASEPRYVEAIDVDSRASVHVPLSVTMQHHTQVACLLLEGQLGHLQVLSCMIVLDTALNRQGLQARDLAGTAIMHQSHSRKVFHVSSSVAAWRKLCLLALHLSSIHGHQGFEIELATCRTSLLHPPSAALGSTSWGQGVARGGGGEVACILVPVEQSVLSIIVRSVMISTDQHCTSGSLLMCIHLQNGASEAMAVIQRVCCPGAGFPSQQRC